MTTRPVDGPHPEHVQDERGIKYPGQLRPENLIWETWNGETIAFYSGEDIGAYRPTETGYEARLGGWAPEEFQGRFLETDKTRTEQQAQDMVLFNFNLYLRSQPEA